MSQRAAPGEERVQWVRAALERHSLDALVCALPSNVLMISGYWPVVGLSVAAATRDGRVAILAPKDEAELADLGWADQVKTYSPGSLSHQLDPQAAMATPLHDLFEALGLDGARVGFESDPTYEGSSYSATFRLASGMPALLRGAAADCSLISGAQAITELRFALTSHEAAKMRLGGQMLATAFGTAREAIRPGVAEAEVATACSSAFERVTLNQPGVQRAGAFAWCMSGPNSAKAGGAFARTTARRIEAGDLVLLHCNPFVDGYFGDVTRTYLVGEVSGRIEAMYRTIFDARAAALATLGPGVSCAAVDTAARDVISSRGFGPFFTHGVGHSAGFSVISAEYPPRLNPTSPDVLRAGCTVNIEPAIYIEGMGGIRHCDVVTVTDSGFELLTDFDSAIEDLTLKQ